MSVIPRIFFCPYPPVLPLYCPLYCPPLLPPCTAPVLQRGGRTAYFGPLGRHSSGLVEYLQGATPGEGGRLGGRERGEGGEGRAAHGEIEGGAGVRLGGGRGRIVPSAMYLGTPHQS